VNYNDLGTFGGGQGYPNLDNNPINNNNNYDSGHHLNNSNYAIPNSNQINNDMVNNNVGGFSNNQEEFKQEDQVQGPTFINQAGFTSSQGFGSNNNNNRQNYN